MSDTPNGPPQDQTAQPGAGEAPVEAGAEVGAPETAASVPALEARIAELEGQIRDLTDRLLRAHAEMDNVRKRAEREKVDTAKYAITKFSRDIVGVADNFQRALAAVPGDAERSAAMQSLLDGVNMTEREFLNVLERNGVRRIDPKGEIFNPHQHQAVMEQMNPEVAAGTVLQVFQCGYVIEDRVLRPAMVVVATGGAKPPKEQSGDPSPAAAAADGDSDGDSDGSGGAS